MTKRWALSAVLAAVALLLIEAAAIAEPRSPYLATLRVWLETLRDTRTAELDAKQLSRVNRALALLDSEGTGPGAQLRVLRKVAVHWRKLGDLAPGGVVTDALTGFGTEFESAIESIESALPAVAKSSAAATQSGLARLRRNLAEMRRALAAAGAQPTLARAQTLLGVHGKLQKAFALAGKVDLQVAVAWVQCDSVGVLGTPFVRVVNCRVTLHDGYPRRFVVYVPETALFQHAGPAPVVMMFHGTSGTGEKFLEISGWREKAETTGLVAVFPTSLEYLIVKSGKIHTKWSIINLPIAIDEDLSTPELDVTYRPAGYPANAPFPADDIGFIRGVLAHLRHPQSGIVVDDHRVFVTGFSNGAQFAGRCALEMPDEFAAAAYCAETFDGPRCVDGVTPDPVCPASLIPVFSVLGTLDELALDTVNDGVDPGSAVTSFPMDPAAIVAMTSLSAKYIASPVATLQLAPSQFSTVSDPTYTSMSWTTPRPGNGQGNTFRFVMVDLLKHAYPSSHTAHSVNPNDFSAADTFWTFFEANAR